LPRLTTFADDALIAAQSLADLAGDLVSPSLRLGVTGLSRSGKTVFITALVHNLTHGGRLPLLSAYAQGRLARAALEPQPDPAVPRFEIESHVAAMVGPERHWPESTRRISELRVAIEYESATFLGRTLGGGRLALDIVDYPGEWILDLPLLGQSYAEWSRRTLALSQNPTRAPLAAPWREHLKTLDPAGPLDEALAREAAERFTAYLRACRDERVSLSTLPPGRFLMPGDLEGSPALTFAPLEAAEGREPKRRGTLWALMESRYEAYKDVVVRPFFRDHFARLDRQIVLVDLISALNAGPAAVADLASALDDILSAFRPGATSLLANLFRPRIARVLVAATKADHLHHTSHERLERILRRVAAPAIARASSAGALIEVVALASVRATREAMVTRDGSALPAIIGTPAPGERIGAETFSGEEEAAVFPGVLPEDPDEILGRGAGGFRGSETASLDEAHLRFVRFRPPGLVASADGVRLTLPHIRLDRALEFLIGDRLA